MTLKTKCRRHWQSLGITNTERLKDFIAELFARYEHQKDVLIEIYKLAFPEWDRISKIKGYPEIGTGIWSFICRLFQEFDHDHHPDCMPGGAWMNTGFSVNKDLGDWEISFGNCEVEYTEPIPIQTEVSI